MPLAVPAFFLSDAYATKLLAMIALVMEVAQYGVNSKATKSSGALESNRPCHMSPGANLEGSANSVDPNAPDVLLLARFIHHAASLETKCPAHRQV